MIDPTQNISSQLQQSVTSPFQKRSESQQQQQQVRGNDQPAQNAPVKRTDAPAANEGQQKTAQALQKSEESDTPRTPARAPRGSLLDITV